MSISGIMNAIPGWKWISGTIGVLFVGLIGWWILTTFVFLPSDFHEADRKAFELAARDLVDQINANLKASNRSLATIALIPVSGDTTNKEGQRRLEDMISEEANLNLATAGVVGELGETFREWAFGSKASESATSLLKSKGELDAVLLVSIAGRDQRNGNATVHLESEYWSWGQNSEGVRTEPVKATMSATGAVNLKTLLAEGQTEEAGWFSTAWSNLWRWIVAIVGAAAIPFAWLPMTDWVMKKGQNWLGLVYLGVVVVTAMLPWFIFSVMSDSYDAGTGTWIFGVLLGLVCAGYSYNLHDAWTERI